MDEKQTQQHRQHFNLSESAKQKLEELTARRYPGKQRRQSQLVEDLITEAFTKEQDMSIATTGMQEPEPDWLLPVREAMRIAEQEAIDMGVREVYPEHLLLGILGLNDDGVARILSVLGLDAQAIRTRAVEVFGARTFFETPASPLPLSPDRLGRRMKVVNLDPTSQPQVTASWSSDATRDTTPTVIPTAKTSLCPSCKRPVQLNWKHCVFCGASLARICPKCGAPYPEIEGARFCFECGGPLEE